MKTTMDSHFVIETKRLRLKPFRLDDLNDLARICACPEVMRYIGKGKPLDLAATQELLAWIIAQYEELGFGLLALRLKENDKLLGFCGLIRQIIDEVPHIELGYRLDRAFWGQGMASEAALALKNYAFGPLGLVSLVSIIHVDNWASKRVAQKVGLEFWKQTYFKETLVDVYSLKRGLC